MRIIKRLTFGCLFLICGVALLAVLGTLIPNPFVYASKETGLNKRIFVVANTLHTDIAIPLDPETMATLGFLANTGIPVAHPEARWLLIGWGGRSFYLETPTLADIKPGPTFRALTLDSSVMHVDVLAQIAENDPSVTPLAVSSDAYSNLLWTISESFSRKDGAVEPIDGFAFGSSDKFYEAEGGFNALLGCNVWTSRMLRSAGIRTGFWNPLPYSLTMSLRLFNSQPSPAGAPG